MSHDYELVTSLQPEAEYPMEPFEWSLPASQFDVPSLKTLKN